MKTRKRNGTNEPVEQDGVNGVHTIKGKCVALTENGVHRKHDALLITDALNTIQKCDLMPSDLLKQRDELLEALKGSSEVLSEIIKLKGGRDFGKKYMNDQWIKNQQLIKQIEQ